MAIAINTINSRIKNKDGEICKNISYSTYNIPCKYIYSRNLKKLCYYRPTNIDTLANVNNYVKIAGWDQNQNSDLFVLKSTDSSITSQLTWQLTSELDNPLAIKIIRKIKLENILGVDYPDSFLSFDFLDSDGKSIFPSDMSLSGNGKRYPYLELSNFEHRPSGNYNCSAYCFFNDDGQAYNEEGQAIVPDTDYIYFGFIIFPAIIYESMETYEIVVVPVISMYDYTVYDRIYVDGLASWFPIQLNNKSFNDIKGIRIFTVNSWNDDSLSKIVCLYLQTKE